MNESEYQKRIAELESELRAMTSNYDELLAFYRRVKGKQSSVLSTDNPDGDNICGIYTFDNHSFGLSYDGNRTVGKKLVSRPPELTNDAWYRFAGELASNLNESVMNE